MDTIRMEWRRLLGLLAICFGGGVFLSFLLPPRFLVWVEAAALVAAGLLLFRSRRR